jgi:hypothetical protein
MKANMRTAWIVAGATVAGILAGAFQLDPGWLWGIGAGLVGGVVGALAGFLTSRPWPGWVRVPLALGAFLGGQFALWVLLSFVKTVLLFEGAAQPPQ